MADISTTIDNRIASSEVNIGNTDINYWVSVMKMNSRLWYEYREEYQKDWDPKWEELQEDLLELNEKIVNEIIPYCTQKITPTYNKNSGQWILPDGTLLYDYYGYFWRNWQYAP